MADETQPQPPKPKASDTYSTDEIVEVFEHLTRNEKSWNQCIAEHGLDPIHVNRTLKILFGEGGGLAKTAVQAFNLGLQFGAMRLDPIDYDEAAEPPCNCMFCQMRRAMEAAEEGES